MDTTTTSTQPVSYLSSLINKNLHLYTSDGRIFVGQMKCTDNERNIILAMTQEYRQPSKNDLSRETSEKQSEHSNAQLEPAMKKRFVGLVVVPGKYIEKIEVET